MSQHEKRVSDPNFSKWIESGTSLDDDLEIVRLSAARARVIDEAGAAIARELNGPLTALLLYMGEIKQHSHQFSEAAGNRVYLQQVVENALQQTERVCAVIKQQGRDGDAGRQCQGWYSRA
jgi:signal transduction histidine kinase